VFDTEQQFRHIGRNPFGICAAVLEPYGMLPLPCKAPGLGLKLPAEFYT
jgi:hypothetical protein